MIRQPLPHRWSHSQSLMFSAPVVTGEPERISGLKVLPLLAKGVREPRHSPHSHADRKVLPLHVRRADSVPHWVSNDLGRDHLLHFGGTVTLLSLAGAE